MENKEYDIETQIGDSFDFNDSMHLKNHLKHLFKTDSMQKYTTEYTPLNEYLWVDVDDDIVYEYCDDLNQRKVLNEKIGILIKDRMINDDLKTKDIQMQIACISSVRDKITNEDVETFTIDDSFIKKISHHCIYQFVCDDMHTLGLEMIPENIEKGIHLFKDNLLFASLHIEPNEIHMHRIFYTMNKTQ